MKPEFICTNHREWLLERPTEAFNWWEKSFDAGKSYQEMKLWEESVRPLGCAFDAATICIEQKKVIDSGLIDYFSRTAQCLVFSLLKIDQLAVAQRIVSGVQHFVKSLGAQVFDRQKMMDMQRKLHVFLAAYSPIDTEHSDQTQLSIRDFTFSDSMVSIH